MNCDECGTEMQDVTINGHQTQVCMHAGCIMDRMLEQYEGCAHNFVPVDDGWFECTECGQGASTSYLEP